MNISMPKKLSSRKDAKAPRKGSSKQLCQQAVLRVLAPLREAGLVAVAITMTLPFAAQAHKGWLAPSKAVLGIDQWVTVDAGTSTEPFVRDHNAMRLDNLVITAPDGSSVAAENAATGKLRSTFDLQLKQAGTWRIAVINDGLIASWDEDGKTRRWRGPADQLAVEVPARAKDLKISESQGRLETFVTAGRPNDAALKPSGRGLELQSVSTLADLFVGEEAVFRFLIDGQPAANLEVEVIRDGSRYRNALDTRTLTTDAAGLVRIRWTEPGLHWIGASVQDQKMREPRASERRLSYAATVDVLTP